MKVQEAHLHRYLRAIDNYSKIFDKSTGQPIRDRRNVRHHGLDSVLFEESYLSDDERIGLTQQYGELVTINQISSDKQFSNLIECNRLNDSQLNFVKLVGNMQNLLTNALTRVNDEKIDDIKRLFTALETSEKDLFQNVYGNVEEYYEKLGYLKENPLVFVSNRDPAHY